VYFIKTHKYLFLLVILLFVAKLYINSFLLAENGDTYDFFKIAYFLQNFNLDYQSKRMLFLPFLMAPFPSDYFVSIGRVWINLFYVCSVAIFYFYIKNVLGSKKDNLVSVCATLVFAFNIIIFENSFYILADSIFLFFNLLYLYVLKTKGLKSYKTLAFITVLAFYTRPEGLILGFITFVLYTAKSINNKKVETGFIFYCLISGLLVLPYFLRNLYFYDSFFYSGYLSDKAGFLFSWDLIVRRASNFVFGTGGIWLLPTLTLIVDNKNLEELIYKNIPELLVFSVYSVVLLLWGPYSRLYSVPVTILIITTFLLTSTYKPKKPSFKRIFVATAIFVSLSAFYFYTVQIIDSTDFGFRKVGKGASLLFSGFIFFLVVVYTLQKLTFKKFIVAFTFLIVVLNLAVFFDRFIVTRYKYYTIKQAVEYYLDNYKDEGKLAYDSDSGVETWFLKDWRGDFDYLKVHEPFNIWAEKNNVVFAISTQEGGFNDKFMDVAFIGREESVNSSIIKEFKSPLFFGSTKLIKLENYKGYKPLN
jgi:hypothetical protein